MILDGLHEITEFFRTSLPYYTMLYLLPLILILSTHGQVAHGAQEFQVFRMAQYDMPFGNHLGSRSNLLSMEARTIHAKAAHISRRAVLVKLADFSVERYRILVGQYAGAILVLLPPAGSYDDAHKSIVKALESQLLREEVKLAVYFLTESPELSAYYDYIEQDSMSTSDTLEHKRDVSAFQALLNAVFTDGYQLVVNAPQSQAISHTSSEFQAVNLQARLNGVVSATSSKIPIIIITAHYDAFGMATVINRDIYIILCFILIPLVLDFDKKVLECISTDKVVLSLPICPNRFHLIFYCTWDLLKATERIKTYLNMFWLIWTIFTHTL